MGQGVKDRDWLVPSIVLTLASGVFGIILIPNYSGILPAVSLLPLWMVATVILGAITGIAGMMAAGVERPIKYLRDFLVNDWLTAGQWFLCVFLAGLNMTTFMWVKPLLNYLVPFWADPLLADMDKALFLGHDPWILLTWLNSRAMAIFYHRGWFALMVMTLTVVLAQPPSPKKSAVMLTYFALWSIVGPMLHALIPAAGPVFYQQLGYGDRFAHLEAVPETRQLATYLWAVYKDGGFGPASGISAMPSLHIATTVWMIIAMAAFARRWMIPMAISGFVIFVLSISLGWHYAIDGIVGGAAALLCYRLLLAFYSDRSVLGVKRTSPAEG
jgi:hypothetical protein